MKHTLSLILLSFSILGSNLTLSAQCIPDTSITQHGLIPPAVSWLDTINGEQLVFLPPASVGVNYSEVIQVKAPMDTSFQGSNFLINSITIRGILGLPNGFTFGCVPSNCTLNGGDYGCGQLTGLPTAADSLRPKVVLELNIDIGPSNIVLVDTLDNYIFMIENMFSINEIASLKRLRTYPNPTNELLNIEFISKGGKGIAVISNIIGNTIITEEIITSSGSNTQTLNVSTLKAGAYLVTIIFDDQSYTSNLLSTISEF